MNHASQLAHINEAIALTDQHATPEELAAALESLQRDPAQPQADLPLRPAA